MAGPPPLRPLLPLAKRLNQNALIVAAVILGMTVLTAIVVVHPSHEAGQRPSAPAPSAEAPPVPSRPAFLDEPVRVPAARSDTNAARVPGRRWETPVPASISDAFASSGAPEPERGPSARAKAFAAALTSPVVAVETTGAADVGAASAGPPEQPNRAPLAAQEEQLLTLGDSVLRASTRGPGSSADGSLQTRPSERHRAFLEAASTLQGTSRMPDVQAAGSPYTLRTGTVIPGLLLTAINSDLPGDIVGQVSHDVFDSRTERTLLVPQGARLIGTYDNQVAVGEDRLLVAWTRLIFPDGRSLRLPGLALKDEAGQTGAKDQVNTHWRRAFGSALLLSAISAGVQLSQPPQTSLLGTPSAGQVAAGALGQELSNVALELLRRGMNTPPTITIRQGHPFNIFLNGDLVFTGPYEDQAESAR